VPRHILTREEKIDKLAVKVRAHGEDRDVECLVKFNAPAAGRKQIWHGEKLLEEVAMTAEECQENLFAEGASA
jgi:hypothetical protein